MTDAREGSIFLALCLGLSVAAVTGFGVWGWFRAHRVFVEEQLRLDRCAGEQALTLQSILNRIDISNQQMQVLRAAAIGTILVPAAREALRLALLTEQGFQEIQRAHWLSLQVIWVVKHGCSLSGDLALPLPSLPWTRDPPDPLGPKPLRWTAREAPAQYSARILAWRKRVRGSAEVFYSGGWHARWAS